MYESLKPWLNIPAKILPFVKRTGTGSKEFGEAFDIKCYILGESEVVKDQDGKEVVSNTQVYVNGLTTVTVMDRIVLDDGEHDIIKISAFYRDGKPDIKVVYL